MRKLLVLILCAFLAQTFTFSAFAEQDNYNVTSKQISQVEKQVFGKTFPKDTPETRLARLEVNLLGAAQSGAPDKRLQTILTAAHNFETEYTTANGSSNYASAWDTTDTGTNSGGFWNGVKNFFGTSGYMTGYTPPIAPYGYNMPYGYSPNPYYSGYQTPRMNYPSGWNKYYRNNYGYYNTNRNIDSGCGVHILD